MQTSIDYIAEVNRYNGKPGLLSTLETIENSYITSDEEDLFEEFKRDIISYATAYFKKNNINPLEL
jgi:hypothetical protein